MVQAINLKKGMIFSQDGKLIKVLKANHHKPGKGNTVMQMDLRDVKSGAVVHKTMRPTEKVDLVEVTKKNAQYLYNDGSSYVFMDTSTYDQLAIPNEQIGDESKYLLENMVVSVIMHDGETLGIQLPNTVDLKVAKTEPNIKGDTSSGGGKPATMETGLVVNVPFFINEGDVLTINTSDGTYVSRANK